MRLPDEHYQVEDALGTDLVFGLLSYSAPLSPDTMSDVKRACLVTCDDRLFQRLRVSPEIAPVSGVNQMLSRGVITHDIIGVKKDSCSGDGGEFTMTLEVPHFHKRMVVSKRIRLEFIAQSEC